ncbi:hypothetical protein ACE60T_005792 [Salmonella enterica]
MSSVVMGLKLHLTDANRAGVEVLSGVNAGRRSGAVYLVAVTVNATIFDRYTVLYHWR